MFIDLLRQELGASKSAGGEVRFCCPFCGESDYKFYVKEDNGLYLCFKCEEKGNPVTFVMNYFSVPYNEAVDILETFDYDVESEKNSSSLSQYGGELTLEEKLRIHIMREGQPLKLDVRNSKLRLPVLPSNTKTLMDNFNNSEAAPFFKYLHSRGVTLEQIQKHQMSYVIHGEVQLESGKPLTLRNHLVFFTFNQEGDPVYWNTRSIEISPFIKSFNAPSRVDEYSKNNTIFNLNNARKTDKIVVTEGVFNALTVGESGVATFGKKVTDLQIRLLLDYTSESRQPIYLFLDSDAWDSMISVANRIYSIEPNREVFFVFTGTDEDANDLGHKRCQEEISKAFKADSFGQLRLKLANV
ncbi:DNA primase [Bacillus phage Shbh1]|uniref:DNA primase-like protein n=1 Tax=Bacillus phage Shbh1 TaxID=1796992 RepID=A0A142F1H1_9CAUD|nr:DNA primase [Bacillus phage Shbh1]AMQ66628.1 DNA primase-like protein [Bacillus phage Shbh1]